MKPCRWLFLMLALLVAAPAVQAQLYKQPGPNSPTEPGQVQLIDPAEGKLAGRVSIPDSKLSVLVQPEGRDWRSFRTEILPWVVGVLTVGMVLLLALFFVVRGRIRIPDGPSGLKVLRFNAVDRFAHWTTAASFLVLALTGLITTFGRPLLIPLLGHGAFSTLAQWTKDIHNFFSVPFVVGVVLIVALWVRDNAPEREDLKWLRNMGGLFSKGGMHPECGRFNAGQKGIFWAVVLGGLAMVVTGYMLMTPFAFTGIGGMQTVHIFHGVLGGLMMALIIAHIYIGSVGMEGAFDAMGSGEVDENWARDHHRRWYEEQVRKGYADTSIHSPTHTTDPVRRREQPL